MFLGRNEENGIRCIYHGWKFDFEGKCLEMPNVPANKDFKGQIHAHAYKVIEKNGLVWVYMGPKEKTPAFPQIEASDLDDLEIVLVHRECNWMQALEGDIDTSHLGFLHMGSVDPENIPHDHHLANSITPRAPDYEVDDAPWGTTYGAYRILENGSTYWRCANFMFPFWTQTPAGALAKNIHARGWIPIDDNNTMTIWLRRRELPGSSRPLKDGKPLPGSNPHVEYLPTTTGWMGRWRLKANQENDWLIDRDAQRRNIIYSGIDNIGLQDQAVTESMGGITSHVLEHLGPGDLMIVRTRRRVLKAAREFRNEGTIPPGVNDPEVYLGARGGFFLAPSSLSRQAAYLQQVENADRPKIFELPKSN